jgi:hypothetical protein
MPPPGRRGGGLGGRMRQMAQPPQTGMADPRQRMQQAQAAMLRQRGGI